MIYSHCRARKSWPHLRRKKIKPYQHVAVSIVISTAVTIYFKSLACGLYSFLAGVFIDVDHFLDGYLNYGPHFKLEDLYAYCMDIRFKKLSLIFHSYELLFIFWILILAFSLGNIWKAIGIGATQHIIFDQLINVPCFNMDRCVYFLTFRLKNRFKKERLVKER